MRKSAQLGVTGIAVVAFLLTSFPAFADGILQGVITDEAGKPLKDVVVKLMSEDESLTTLETKTKKKGNYVFGVIRRGEYRVACFKDGLRVSWIDVNVATPTNPSFYSYTGDLPYGAEPPKLAISDVTEVTFDAKMTDSMTEPGTYGTGEKISPVDTVVKALEAGNMDEASKFVAYLEEENPDSEITHYLSAFVALSMSDNDKALASIDKCLEINPFFEGASLLKGKILEAQGDVEGAMEWFETEAETAQSETVKKDAYLALAVAAEDLGKPEKAQSALERLLEASPDQVELYQELAKLYSLTGNTEKAQEALLKIAELGGDQDPAVLFNLGAERFNAKDFEGAAKFFEMSIAANPDFPDSYLRLGYTKLNMGDMAAARRNLEKYLSFNPEGPNADTARELVERLPAE